MTLASQFRGDAQAETLAQEEKKATSLAQQFAAAPLADTVGRNLNAAKTTTPEQVLSNIKLSEQTGIPLDAVARNHDEIATTVKQRETDPLDIAYRNPSLAKWLAKPNNAALGQNDIGILKRLESLIPSEQAFVRLADPLRQAESEAIRLPGTVLTGTAAALESVTRTADRFTGGSLSAVDQFLQKHVGRPPDWLDPSVSLRAVGEPIKEAAAEFAVPEERQNIVTDISGAIGQLGAQVAQAIAAPQTLVPSLFAQGADIQAERVQEAGQEGAAASDASILAGAGVTALMEKIGIGQLLNRIPPKVKNDFLRKAADITAAGGIEAAQELVENIAQNIITQQLVNPAQEIVDQGTWREITAAGGAGAFLRAVVQAATRGRNGQKAQQEQQTLDAVVEAGDQTWLKQNAPEKLQEFIAEAKQAGVDTVYVPVEQGTTYFQTANLDMAQVLTAAGVDRQDILAAQATGGDIAIPLEIYSVALGEHHKAGLREFARITPEALTPAEAADIESQRQDIDEMVRRFIDSASDDRAGKIKDDVAGQLIAAGHDRATAERYGTLLDKAFSTLGARSGIDPLALYQRYNLKITRDQDVIEQVDASIDPYLEAIRAGRLPTERQAYGPTFIEALKAAGGLNDEGGELAARDIARQAPGLIKKGGMSADQALSWAYENGYIDQAPTEYLDRFDPNAPTEQAVLDLIDKELSGRPTYSERNQNKSLASFLMAADQLAKEMEKAGVTTGQSNEAIRKALQIGRDSAINFSQYTPEEVEFFRSMGIEVGDQRAETQPRPELQAAENVVTVGGGTPRAGWAENTVVTGADGRPATVYRGSRDGTTSAADFATTGAATGHPSAGLGVWLSADRGDAARYGTVGEYQLDLRNPKIYSIEDFPGFDSIEESRALRERLQAQGHDGVVIDARNVGGPVQFVAFNADSVINAAKTLFQSAKREGVKKKISDLPRDMREELFNLHAIYVNPDASERSFYSKLVEVGELDVGSVDIGEFKPSELSRYIDAKNLPPVVIADGRLVDGQHRIAAARIRGDKSVESIDLTGLIDTDQSGYISEIRRQFVVFSPESVIPAAKQYAQKAAFPNEKLAELGKFKTGLPVTFDFIHNTESATRIWGRPKKGDRFKRDIEPSGRYVNEGSLWSDAPPTMIGGSLTFNNPLVLKTETWKQDLFDHYGKRGKALSEALIADGYDGVVTVAIDERPGRSHTSEILDLTTFDPARALYQGGGVERGQIRIAPSGIEIRLFEKANLSTFIHESGHLFLEVLGDVASSPDAPQQIKDDYAAALKWLGVESRGQIGTEQHEQWARGFEAYLGEGKAPSPELAGIFSRFRAWMIAIYKSLRNLNVELSDEVRGVFDRMIATDEEIALLDNQTPPGEFQNQQESGMTDKQWAKYQELLVEARAETEGQLTARAYNEMRREKEAWWKERLAEVSKEVEAESNQMPVYQAWSFLAEGKYPDGREFDGALERQKLDKSVLLSMYGQEFLNKHLRYKHVYQQEGGLHPSLVATQFGFESASTMVERLAAAPKKEEWVKSESKRRMLEQYGDIMNDGSLPEQAVKAAHNDRRFKALEVELEALGRIIGRAPPKVAQLRKLADKMIADKKVRDIQPYLYLRAERKAAKDYAELAKSGNRAQAYEAKQRQLLNGLLYDRAWKAREEVEKIREYANGLMKKPKQEKLAKAGGSYLQQINDILSAYQFRKLPLKQIDRQENLRQWVEKMQDEGDITAVTDAVIRRVENQPTNYQNVSLEELRGVNDALRNIDHLSVLKNKLLKGKEQRDKDEAREEMLGRLRETRPNRKTLAASEFAKSKAEQLGDKLSGLADALWRPETIIEAMDGGESGPWHDYLWEPANQARATQNQLRERIGRPLEELAASLDKKWSDSLSDDWEIAGRKMTKRDIIGMALNLGNDGNRDKMMRGGYIADGVRRPYTNEDVESAISHLTEQDWKAIQSIWDTVDSLWPDIVAQQQRLSGLPPEKVEAVPFVVNTADGKTLTMRGGYFPVAYDPRQSQAGEKQASSENAADALLAGQYSRAATPKGHLKERTDYAAPIQLDYQAVLTRHIDDVITDLSHREFLKQAQWIISDSQIKNSLMERIGETGYKALRGFIGHTVGADRPIPDSSAKAWQRISDQIIANTAVYALGFRIVTAWGNLAVAPIQAAARVSPSYMIKGFTQFYSNLRESTDFVHSLSPFMRDRARDLDASYVEVMNKLGGNRSVRRQIARASMQVHRWADYLATHGIWLGRYQQAVDSGVTQEEAARLADKAIRQTQTAGAPKDLSGVERDPAFKMFRLFIGPMLIMNNRIRESVTRSGAVETWPEALGTMMAAWFLPAVIFELAVGRGPDEEDEPEDWYQWMATKVGMYPMQTIPLVRDIAATAEAQILGEYRQVRAAPIAEAGNAVVKAFATIGKEFGQADEVSDVDAGKISKDTLRALGPIFGLPTNQIDVTGSFVFDVMTNEYEPDSPLDYRYLLVRRPKGEEQ